MSLVDPITLGSTKTLFVDGDRSARYPKREEYVHSGILFLNGESIHRGIIDKTAANFISEKKYNEIKKGRITRNDILLTTRGNSVGDVAFVNIDDKGLINAQMLILRVDSTEISPKYLFYYLTTQTLRGYISNFASGSAQPQIPIRDLRKIPIYLPDVDTQKRIAAILSAYDDLIENNQRRIALLEKMAEEIYREWFIRMRFPGHEKVTTIKGVPEGWRMVKLESAFQYTGGGTPSKEVNRYWEDGEVNWFTPSDITGAAGIFLERSGEQCSEEGFNNSSAKMFPAYSVMLTSRATIGAVGINLTPACTNQGFISCIPNAQYPLPYLYHWLKLAKPHFELLAVGATFAELTKGTFKRIEILTPPEPIVNEFARIVSPLFVAVENYLQANKKLIETRDKLLPRLISGKLSVENLDIQFPPSMAEELKTEATTHA